VVAIKPPFIASLIKFWKKHHTLIAGSKLAMTMFFALIFLTLTPPMFFVLASLFLEAS
jgi:hypothetical protein